MKATLLELSILNQSLFAGLLRLSDGTPAFNRTEVVRQRIAEFGLAGGSKTLNDVDQQVTSLFYKLFQPLQVFSAEPEHRATVPSAADFKEACRLLIESMAPWEACGRGAEGGVGQGTRTSRG